MCGIAGIYDPSLGPPPDAALLKRMNDSQVHRGPDEEGIHRDAGIGLAHRRLSIIDLSSGQQPLYNEDRSVVTVYNGEIYNFQSLTDELTRLGHRFRTRSDTESIVHAWEEWGESCVDRFRGMFAFAVWDSNRNTLFLARDRLGIKPLYYAELTDGSVVFGSELKALLVHPGVERRLDHAAVEDYFAYGYIPEPRTILKTVKKLAPGHTLTYSPDIRQPRQRRYWDVRFDVQDGRSQSSIESELIERIREAVRIRLISEVPLGAFLSGGVDSSAVVSMMAGLSAEPVNTCTISFGDPKYNESEFAARVAGQFGTNHYVEQVDPNDFGLVDRLASLYDEPYADSSAIPTYRVCELARKRVTVVLSGDGGDENLAGYRRYRWHAYEERVRRALPATMRHAIFGSLGFLYPKADWAPKIFRAKSTFQAIARDSVPGYFHSVSIVPDTLRRKLFSESLRSELGGYNAIEVMQRYATEAPSDDPLSIIQYIDMKTYLPGDILTKVDRASMAHSLEVRVPLLDHELVEWISGIPSGLKLRGREGKYIFKKALERHLPNEILYRSKMGFAVPLASWFRRELRERVRDSLSSSALLGTGLFDGDFVLRIIDQHQAGTRNHATVIWALLMFESFCRQTLENQG